MGGFMGGRGGGMGRGMQDFREAMEPDFLRRDIPIFVRQLKLTEDQSGVLETLYVDYETTFSPESQAILGSMTEIGRSVMESVFTPERREQMRGMWEKMQQEMRDQEAANGPMDDEARREFFRSRAQKAAEDFAKDAQNNGLEAQLRDSISGLLVKVEAWQKRKTELRDGFTQGIKAVLDDDQLTQWPAFERFLVREKSLPRGRISGENLNLFFVIDELRMPQDEFAKIEPLFNDYEMRLDSALRSRNSYIEESMPKVLKAMQGNDASDATRVFKRQAELRSAVRDVNDEFRRMMVVALGESPWAKSLDAAILENGWERFFRATATDRMFEAAIKLEGLDPTVLQGIKDLHAGYKGEIAPMNERLKTLARTEEPDQIVADGERFVSMVSRGFSGMASNFGPGGGFGNDRGREDPSRKLMDERNEVGQRYAERLKAMLTPEQFEKLPSNRGGRGQGGPFGNMGPGGNFDPQALLDRLPEEQRKQFMEAVDKNKNGKIDEDERDGIREYMRQQFGNMRNGGDGNGGGQRGNGGGRNGRGGSNEV